MKKLSNLPFALLISVIFLSSCNLYNPAYINTPVYEGTGNVNIGANLGSTQSFNVSTNPVEHLSIIGNVSTAGTISNEESDVVVNYNPNVQQSPSYNYRDLQAEGAVGYYYKMSNDIQHDFHLGYGFGTSADLEGDFAYEAKFNNYFIQSSLAIPLDEKTTGVLISKFNFLDFYGYDVTLLSTPFGTEPSVIINERNFLLNQFGVGFISNVGPLDLNLQGIWNLTLDRNINEEEFPVLSVFLGINMNIEKIVKKKEK